MIEPIESGAAGQGSGPAADLALSKSGGPIRDLGEKFTGGSLTGSATMTVPLAASPGRSGVEPDLTLSYDSAAGNGPFGFGWQLHLPMVSRRTDRGLPRYADDDTFVMSGAEDLVPVLDAGGVPVPPESRTVDGTTYRIRRYRPRIEGMFARIEMWVNTADPADSCWRTISRDNITTWYGRDATSRVTDPRDPLRVFTWLACEGHDDKGNVVVYGYKSEDSANVGAGQTHEQTRDDTSRSASRYLKSVRYGNTAPYYPVLAPDQPRTALPDASGWLFELVLDYGEHDPANPTPTDTGSWNCRPDPFSTYRSGFEVRTYRRCARALMFHRFPELGPAPTLVRATDLRYAPHAGLYSFLTGVGVTGYRQADGGGYTSRVHPDVELTYREPVIDPTVRTVTAPNLPAGVDGDGYLWADLDGEGAAGVLTRDNGAWYFARNESPLRVRPDGGRDAAFGAAMAVERISSVASSADRPIGLLDLDGDGRMDLVVFDGANPGHAARTTDGTWSDFTPFEQFPAVDWGDPRLRLADLTGDGLPDVVLVDASAEDGMRWAESLGRLGYGPLRTAPVGPLLALEDRTVATRFADMTGDGLTDLVTVSASRIAYRPNLGYGRFGAEVTMTAAPLLDLPGQFDSRRLILADIDGTGTADLIYLGSDSVSVYFNQSGNGWSTATRLTAVPPVDDVTRVAVVDLLGTGTACLVWSSPLPHESAAPTRYVDLLGGAKPHLLTGYANGTGRTVTVDYQPSTYFSLADALAGQPWASRLPFPVQCVSRVTDTDAVRQTSITSTTTYHEGYFDGVEREFRGFGRVEELDIESFPDESGVRFPVHQAPVLTKTWYHTGAPGDIGAAILHQYRDQYYANPVVPELRPENPRLPAGLAPDEFREALRACKGAVLRREVYGVDATPEAVHPYQVTESSYRLTLVQPRGPNSHACLLLSPDETISYVYERRPEDPRVSHALVLDSDDMGLVRRSATVVYPRRAAPAGLAAAVSDAQARRYVTIAEHDYTTDVDEPDTYRLRAVCESRGYELTGLTVAAGDYVSTSALAAAVAAGPVVPYEQDITAGLRLLSRTRTEFLADDLSGPLAHGVLSGLGLVDRTYRLAMTAGLVQQAFAGAISGTDLTDGGYVHRGDSDWWLPSDRAVYPAGARDHFYLPSGMVDALGSQTSMTREYDLLVTSTTDALGNTVTVAHDYHVLAPMLRTDANQNRSAVGYDELGVIVATAVMGKSGAGAGDTLDDPTTRIEYDLFRFQNLGTPNVIRTFSREVHGPANPRWHEQYSYLDGHGAPLLSKAQAPPGLARVIDPGTGTVVEVDTTPQPRWVGSGRTVVNNKGMPVRQYEAYFSATPEYDSEPELAQVGVSDVLSYDPLGRNIRVDLPDGTITRTEFDAWHHRVFDRNDTVLDSLWYAERGSPDPGAAEPADPQEYAAWLAAAHANTPAIAHVDTRGQIVQSLVDNGAGDLRSQRRDADLTGRTESLYDSRDRLVAEGLRDLLGRTVRSASAERGGRWTFPDVLGHPVVAGEQGGGRTFRTSYDAGHRPVSVVCVQGATRTTVSRVVYGEQHAQAVDLNLRGAAYQTYDQSGVVTVGGYDFKGNLLGLHRRFTTHYAPVADWAALDGLTDPAAIEAAATPYLELTGFGGAAAYDALDRTIETTLADGTVLTPAYDVGNHLTGLTARLGGTGAPRAFLTGVEYDAKGQRTQSRLGNGTTTTYEYDPATLRLAALFTHRDTDPAALRIQDLAFTYDPAGNLTDLADQSQQTQFFAAAEVAPGNRYRYDALYQLIAASGREHASVAATAQTDQTDAPVGALPHPNDTAAVRRYTEQYGYDNLGNLVSVAHSSGGNGGTGWTRRYRYAYQDNPADRTNRLVATSLPGDAPAGPYHALYTYDAGGNMTSLPHLPDLSWDVLDRLHRVDLGGGGTAYYTYGGTGHRTRTVIERLGGLRVERIYLGPVEIYREWSNGTLRLQRTTMHIADEAGRIAQVDTTDVDTSGGATGIPVIRYVHTNQAGSAVLETDEHANPLTYEEYHPYGSTAYRSGTAATDVSLKRYRFTGAELDAETGFYCMGARFYASWLGRWISSDPAGFADGLNTYAYCRNSPVLRVDPSGTQSAGGSQSDISGAWRDNPGSFQASGSPVVRDGISWQAYTHPTYGRVYQPLGSAEQDTVLAWGGPPVIPEARWLARHGAPAAPSAAADHPVVTGSGASGGSSTVTANPEGFTLEVPNNFDDDKIRAYRERITTDRGVGHRSTAPGSRSRTNDIRRANRGLRDAYENSLDGGRRPPGTDIDHTVELQHIIRSNNTVRPQDHRPQISSLNRSQGSSARHTANRQIAGGAPEEVPAGGVARSSEMGRFGNLEGFRTTMRGLGYGLMVAGPVLTFWGASGVDNTAVRYGGYGLAGAEGLGSAYYMYGRFGLGGASGNLAGRAAMASGARFATIAGGAAQALISGYMAYDDYQNKDWTAFAFDAAAALGGVALIASAVVTAPIWGTGLAIAGVATGVAAGVYHLGRWQGWWH